MNLHTIISLGENQICLHPGNASPGIDQKFCNAVRADAAFLVQILSALVRDGFHTALNRDAVRAAKKIKSFFIPEIDARLEADFHRTLGNPFEQAKNIFAHAENLIDEIDILDAARNQRIHFLQHRVNAALAEFVTKERLVAEGARPGTSASKFQFGAEAVVIGENVVAMPVGFKVVILEIERPQGGHVSDSRSWAYVQLTVAFFEAATNNLFPGFAGKFRESLIGFATQSDVTSGFTDGSCGCCRRMRANGDVDGFALQARKPFHRHAQFRGRAAPEKIRRRSRNNEKIWRETFEAEARF